MNKLNKILLQISILAILLLLLNGCYPDRNPVSAEEYNTHRPNVLYKIPADGDSVEQNMTVEVWFDGLMEANSVEEAFSVTLAVDEEPWTVIKTAAAADQSFGNSQKLFLALSGKGAFYSVNNAESWIFINALADRDVLKFKIDPKNDAVIFALTSTVILKSEDGGHTWFEVSSGLDHGTVAVSLTFDPQNSSKIWIGTNTGVYRTTDGAANWQKSGELPLWRGQEISAIAVDANNTDIVYIATKGRFVYKTEDGGASWVMLRGETNRLPTSQIYDITIDPLHENRLYAATINKGVYKSEDGGLNWLEFNSGLSDLNARMLKFDFSANPSLYLSTTDKLFIFDSDSAKWREINLPESAYIHDFHFSAQNNREIKIIQGGKVFYSADQGNSWIESSAIERESITVKGNMAFEKWHGEKMFINAAGDTVTISPYVNTDALAAWKAGFISEPPIDPNPYATVMTFEPDEPLYRSWKYLILIRGAFESNIWRGIPGARNTSGMSLELDDLTCVQVK